MFGRVGDGCRARPVSCVCSPSSRRLSLMLPLLRATERVVLRSDLLLLLLLLLLAGILRLFKGEEGAMGCQESQGRESGRFARAVVSAKNEAATI